MISNNVSIPVIAHGGAGNKEDISFVINQGGADAVAVSSILHYEYISNNNTTAHSLKEGNVEFLKNKKSFNSLNTTTISEIKNELYSKGISCRI
jgi:cyclase